jgi:hypothetical protein
MTRKFEFPFDCFRQVTILTDDLIVYQGNIERFDGDARKHDEDSPPSSISLTGDIGVQVEPRFVSLALSCVPVLLVPTGPSVCFVPLENVYPLPGIVRINLNQITAVSDFIECVEIAPCAASGVAPSDAKKP